MFDPPLALRRTDVAAAETLLLGLYQSLGLRTVVLVDIHGRIIAQGGITDDFDPVGLGALAAASVAATQGLAHLIQEQHFSHITHLGVRKNLHLAMVGNIALLISIFGKDVAQNDVRSASEDACHALFDLLDSCKKNYVSKKADALDISVQDIDNLFR